MRIEDRRYPFIEDIIKKVLDEFRDYLSYATNFEKLVRVKEDKDLLVIEDWAPGYDVFFSESCGELVCLARYPCTIIYNHTLYKQRQTFKAYLSKNHQLVLEEGLIQFGYVDFLKKQVRLKKELLDYSEYLTIYTFMKMFAKRLDVEIQTL